MNYYIYNIIQGFKNLYYYLPTIWRDRDDDFYYTQELLLKKLKKQYKFLQKELHTDYKKQLQALRVCILILERDLNYHYCNYYFDKIEIDPNNSEKHMNDCLMMEERDGKWFSDVYSKHFYSWWN